MQRKIHMRDQVGANKVWEIMHHYDHPYSEAWLVKFLLIGLVVGLGVHWPG